MTQPGPRRRRPVALLLLLPVLLLTTGLLLHHGGPGAPPAPPEASPATAAEAAPAAPEAASVPPTARTGLAPVTGETEEPFSWEALLEALRHRRTRGPAMERALARPDLVSWLLERLRQADFGTEHVMPVGYLLRGVLSFWDTLPAQPPMDRDAFLVAVLDAALARDLATRATAFAWWGQRFLEPRHHDLVAGTRPADVDAEFPPDMPMGRARGRLYLSLLEDVLRAFLDAGQPDALRPYFSDPSHRVRSLAVRLWVTVGGGEPAAVFDLLPEDDLPALAVELAESLDPAAAANLLLEWSRRLGATRLLPAWLTLQGRAPDVLPAMVLQEMEYAGQTGEALPPNAGLQEMYEEGQLRMALLGAWHGGLQAGQAPDETFLGRVAREDPNPLVRVTAWQSLVRAGDAASRAAALRLLADSRFTGALPGDFFGMDGMLRDDLRALSASLEGPERQDFAAAVQALPIPEADRLALLQAEGADGADGRGDH